jgi:energy-coupling factor transporter ATP-binding protein EcfA2
MPEPKPEPKPEPSKGSIDDLIRQLIAATATSVDPDTVRDIVREELDQRPNRTITIEHTDGAKVEIDGAHPMLEEALKWIQTGAPIMLIGPTGTGKSVLAKQIAKALDKPFFTTAQALASYDLLGYIGPNGYVASIFRAAVDVKGVHLCDEFDAYDPAAALAANAGMTGDAIPFPDTPEGLSPEGTVFIAACNTWGNGADREYVGRNQMDAATLNRFVMLPIDYSLQVEAMLCGLPAPKYVAPKHEGSDNDPSEVSEAVKRWFDYVQNTRSKVAKCKMRHPVSTRTLRIGVDALKAGLPLSTVVARLLRRDLDSTSWGKVTCF